jgi:AhpD family alkylhydroperoxidase
MELMQPRIDFMNADAAAGRALLALQNHVNSSGLERPLLELVKLRASQINHCAYCIDMHTKDALAAGESAQRLFLLDAWREAPFYSERERAALEWTESVTLLADTEVPDEVYALARQQFTEEELVKLTYAIVAINAWNRLCVSFRAKAGTYEVRKSTAREAQVA